MKRQNSAIGAALSAAIGLAFVLSVVTTALAQPATTDKDKMMEHHHAEMMTSVDTNKDGMISREEFNQHHEKMFIKCDKNKDGMLDKDEHEMMMKEMHDMMAKGMTNGEHKMKPDSMKMKM